jgi:hypothetical protein
VLHPFSEDCGALRRRLDLLDAESEQDRVRLRRWGEGRVRDSGQMDDGVDAAVDLVDAGKGLDDLAVVGEVGADEARSAVR